MKKLLLGILLLGLVGCRKSYDNEIRLQLSKEEQQLEAGALRDYCLQDTMIIYHAVEKTLRDLTEIKDD